MLSNFEMTVDLEEETIAVILKKKTNPRSGDELKVYIPKVMRGIDMGKPKIKISPVQYRGAFANSGECKPQISHMFREQNYLVGTYQNNANSKPILKVVYDEEGDIEKTYVPVEEAIRCKFMNGKLEQLRLNTDDNLEFAANEFIYDQYLLKGIEGEDDEEDDDDVVEHVKNFEDEDEEPKDKDKYKRQATIGTKIRSV